MFVPPPVYRDDATFSDLVSKVKSCGFSKDMVKLLEVEIPKDSRVFSSQQIVDLLNCVGFTDLKVEIMKSIKHYVYGLSAGEMLNILNTLGFSKDKLVALDLIADFLSDATEENKNKIINDFGFAADRKTAKEILDRVKCRTQIFGYVKEKYCTFVIDVSPSMWFKFKLVSGADCTRIDFVKEELSNCISKQLEPYQFFNIIVFGGSVNKWRNDPVPVNQSNITSALQYISGLKDIGSTNISGALDAAFNSSSNLNGIYLLSDGYPNGGIQSPEAMIGDLKKKLSSRNVKPVVHVTSFMLGGSETPAEKSKAFYFLQGIAETSGGSFRNYN